MKRLFLSVLTIAGLLFCPSCTNAQILNVSGLTVATRFNPPPGFVRVEAEPGSYSEYLRNLPLKPHGSPVLSYLGKEKANKVWAAVLDIPLLKKDLIQCADAVMKIRAEYLYSKKQFDGISFHITNGMEVPFSRYAAGERVEVAGNSVRWVGGAEKGTGRIVFDSYLEFIYSYAGTYSLSKELEAVSVAEIRPGDIFIFGGTPGHAVLVLDVAVQKKTGKKIMLLAQSYMPSQDIHILKSSTLDSPWYEVPVGRLTTPEWNFESGSLKRFQ